MLFVRIFLALVLSAASALIIFEGNPGGGVFTGAAAVFSAVLYVAYALAGKMSVLKGSLAATLSEKSLLIWFPATLAAAVFLNLLGVIVAYNLMALSDTSASDAAIFGSFAAIFLGGVVFFSSDLGFNRLALWRMDDGERGGDREVDEFLKTLEVDIQDSKKQGAVILLLCASIGFYAAFQARQAIHIVDSGGVNSEAISALRNKISNNEKYLMDLLDKTDFSSEAQRTQYEKVKEQVDILVANDRADYEAEVEKIARQSQDLTGKYVLTYFSSFFVRVASVFISLGFFTLVFFQYRRVDRQRAELAQLRLAYKALMKGALPEEIKKARSALAIRDFVPSKRETDSFSAFAAATIGAVPEFLQKSGVRTPQTNKKEPDSESANEDG